MEPSIQFSADCNAQAALAMSQAFELVGMDMFQAMNEVAYDLGGEDFAEQVVQVAFDGYTVLPNPAALDLLMHRRSGAATEVMERAQEIQKQRQQEEINARFPHQNRFKRIGRALVTVSALIWTGEKL